MSLLQFFFLCLLSIFPISELRGALIFAFQKNISFFLALPLCVLANACVPPLVYFFLRYVNRFLLRWERYRLFFDKFIIRTRKKLEGKVEKYGYWGIVIFVGIPLPITGAYTGTLGAWILGLEPKKVFLANLVGLVMSATIVTVLLFTMQYLGEGPFKNVVRFILHR